LIIAIRFLFLAKTTAQVLEPTTTVSEVLKTSNKFYSCFRRRCFPFLLF